MSDTQQQEQQMIADSVRRWATQTSSPAQREASAAHNDGCPPERWCEIAEMGWLAFPIPAEDEGLGGSLEDLCVLAEELGRALLIEPFVANAIVASHLMVQTAEGALRSQWLGDLAGGQKRMAFAMWEPQCEGLVMPANTTAQQTPDGFAISGAKGLSPGLSGADALLLVARIADDDYGLFFVNADAAGLTLCNQRLYDGRHAASLQLEKSPATLLRKAPWAQMQVLVQSAIDRGIIAHCAETAGAASVALATTIEYVKTRKQFGRSISSNQVVQHRLVDLYVEVQELKALWRYVANEPSPGNVSALAIRCIDVARHVWEETLQLHGAIGMTEEYELGEYLRRLALATSLYGGAAVHHERLAALSFKAGYA